MPPAPGSYNWTQDARYDDEGFADRMSRGVLLIAGGLTPAALELLETGEEFNIREGLDSRTAKIVLEIEEETGLTLKFREADVGRGASGMGAAVQIVETVAVAGGAAAAIREASRVARWAYRKIATSTGHRPMISLGAAEHFAIADLIDRVDAVPRLFGSGDMNSNSPDRAFTGGDAFFVVLATDSELHHYHVSAYGEVFYIGTSPLIPSFMDAPSSYWASGDPAES